jgi:tetratricopeptide (TPR) repeat protein
MVKQDPRDEQGELLLRSGNWLAAQAHFNARLNKHQQQPDDLVGLAHSLIGLGKIEEAIVACQNAIAIDPKHLRAYGAVTGAYQRLGRFTEAIEAASKAISINPTLTKPYVEIVRSKKIGFGDATLLYDLEHMSTEPNRSEGERFQVHLALGKGFDDLKQYQDAIVHFDLANEIADRVSGFEHFYNFAAREQEVEFLRETFTQGIFLQPQKRSERADPPILIVGMIRSGTTLLNELLCRHPQIDSAGELRFWEEEGSQFLRAAGSKIDRDRLGPLGERYRTHLLNYRSKGGQVIDKMPTNFRHLGLIRLAVPDAKIIHICRHPVDTCLSIYTTDFGPRPPQFAFNRDRIVHAYKMYDQLMNHWQAVLPPGSILDVHYHDLVCHGPRTLKAIVKFAGLNWTDEMLAPAKDAQNVATPSRWQARQPIYTSSLNRWKNYQAWLGSFRELLPPGA